MVDWSEPAKRVRKRKYRPLLEDIRAAQPEHPNRWAVLARFPKPPTAAETAYRLKKTHPEFEFLSQAEDGEGVVYARFIITDSPQ